MPRITGQPAEPFYNLDFTQYSCVYKKLLRCVHFQSEKKGIPVNRIIDTCLLYVIRNLSRYRRACMYNFKFIKNDTNGRIRITQQFVNLILRLNDSLNYTEKGGWKETIDIDTICIATENIMNTKYTIVDYIHKERENAIREIDYTDIIHMTNDTSFRDIGLVDDVLTRVGDFQRSLYLVSRLNAKYERSLTDAYHHKCVHRLNLRTQAFKPWKLYSCRPIYTDVMLPMSYYDYPFRTEFDTMFIMPEDIGRIITEFVGYAFISNIRNGLIIATKDKDVIRNEIESSLYKWKKDELLDFAHAVPYNYIKLVERFPYAFVPRSSYTKETIIGFIMTNFDNKELYYPFYRDVMILTKIIQQKRIANRKQRTT